MFVSTEDVPANNHIWIFGDNLLCEAAGHYEKIRKNLKEKLKESTSRDNRMYIDRHYAVKIVSPGLYGKDNCNIPALILDGLVEALNQNPKIPHTIIIVINDRRFWNNRDLLSNQMAWIMKKFLKELNKILDNRKYALDDKAVNWDYPRLFITRPLPLPSNLPTDYYPIGFRSNRRKFNKILDNLVEDGKFTLLNLGSFTAQNKDKLFTETGIISEKGFEQFWIDLNDAIQKDDAKFRVMMNKIKAKQLAQNMTSELMKLDESDNDESSISKPSPKVKTSLPTKKKNQNKKSPVRRSLKHSFDAIDITRERMKSKSQSPSQTGSGGDTRRVDRRDYHKPTFKGFFKPHRRYHHFNPFYQPQHFQPHGYPHRYFHY